MVKYKAYLLESGYASDQTDGHFIKVAKLKRKDAMSNDGCRKRGSSVKKKKINFVTAWDPMFPDINEALGKFQHILEEDNECRNLFSKGSFRVSYKRGHKNLKELIAPSKIALPDDCEERGNSKRQYQGKCVKCGGCGKSVKGRKRSSGIYTCQVLEENTKFKSTQTGEKYKIRQDIDCKSNNIIYLVTCKKCGFQGVGSCTKLSQRVSNYITNIEKKSPGCNIEKHFLKADHSISDFSVLGIVKLETPPPDPIGRLREFEGYWMIKLNTLEPYGLNGINEYERIVRKSGLRNMFDIDNPGES